MYQIVFIIPISQVEYMQSPFCEWGSCSGELEDKIREEALRLLQDSDKNLAAHCRIIFTSTFEDEYMQGQPTFTAYFSTKKEFEPGVEKMVNDVLECASPVFPAIFAESIDNHIPEVLRLHQGVCYGKFIQERATHNQAKDPDAQLKLLVEVIVMHALHSFGLASARRVFISYAQKETAAIAYKVYLKLLDRKYEPFLDRTALEPAKNFQEGLYHELSDCDIMLILDSGYNRVSNWCRKELENAQATGMGIAVLAWNYDGANDDWKQYGLCKVVNVNTCSGDEPTNKGGFANIEEPTEDTLNELLNQIDRMRAKAFFFKIMRLLDRAKTKYDNVAYVITEDACLLKTMKDGVEERYLPVVRVPVSMDYERAEKIGETGVVYNPYCIAPQYKNHLDWLKHKTSIKAIPI